MKQIYFDCWDNKYVLQKEDDEVSRYVTVKPSPDDDIIYETFAGRYNKTEEFVNLSIAINYKKDFLNEVEDYFFKQADFTPFYMIECYCPKEKFAKLCQKLNNNE